MRTKKTIIFTALAAFIATASGAQTWTLQGDPTATPRIIETLEADRVAAPQTNPNQSYLAKQMQAHMAACLSPMLWELSYSGPNVRSPYPPHTAVQSPHDWRVSNQVFHYRGAFWDWRPDGSYIKFRKARWDPEVSDIHYGPKRVAQNVNVENAGKTKLIRNDSNTDVDVSYKETESLTNSFSTSVTQGLTLDMTVTSETSVSGSYAGVTGRGEDHR